MSLNIFPHAEGGKNAFRHEACPLFDTTPFAVLGSQARRLIFKQSPFKENGPFLIFSGQKSSDLGAQTAH